MDVRWFQDFLAVAEVGNFTRAAEVRNTSQAAFSRRIQALESWLGVMLIDRSSFPTRLTPEGDRFREHAAEILRQIIDAKIDLSGESITRTDHVRVALPHALATGRLPAWWASWSRRHALNCTVVPGNVHDTVTSLVSGEVDLLICFHHEQQPIHLEPEQYERVVIGVEKLRPYAAQECAAKWSLRKSSDEPLPLLMYSPGAYLGRVVNLICEAAPSPLKGRRVLESDMADVLRNMAVAGYGIAWLPGCVADAAGSQLVALDDDRWAMTLSLIAYRDRANERPSIKRLWTALLADRAGG
jgi:LysR family transcriptional regulator, hypochlorite-specific transcription factor HypT